MTYLIDWLISLLISSFLIAFVILSGITTSILLNPFPSCTWIINLIFLVADLALKSSWISIWGLLTISWGYGSCSSSVPPKSFRTIRLEGSERGFEAVPSSPFVGFLTANRSGLMLCTLLKFHQRPKYPDATSPNHLLLMFIVCLDLGDPPASVLRSTTLLLRLPKSEPPTSPLSLKSPPVSSILFTLLPRSASLCQQSYSELHSNSGGTFDDGVLMGEIGRGCL